MPDDPSDYVDPDCRAGKHASCVGGPCACECHADDPTDLAAPTEAGDPLGPDPAALYAVPEDKREPR